MVGMSESGKLYCLLQKTFFQNFIVFVFSFLYFLRNILKFEEENL